MGGTAEAYDYFWIKPPCNGSVTFTWFISTTNSSSENSSIFITTTSEDPSGGSYTLDTSNMLLLPNPAIGPFEQSYGTQTEFVFSHANLVVGLVTKAGTVGNTTAEFVLQYPDPTICAHIDIEVGGQVVRHMDGMVSFLFSPSSL